MINGLKKQGEWKVQWTIAVNFFSSKDSNDTPTMLSKSNNIGIMIGNGRDEIIQDIEESMEGREFFFW